MTMKHFGTTGMVVNTDEQIKAVEQMVEVNQVKYLITLVVENPIDEQGLVCPVHLLQLGTPISEVRDYLQVALAMVDDMIGKQQKQ